MGVIDRLADKLISALLVRLDDAATSKMIDPVADQVAQQIMVKLQKNGSTGEIATEVARLMAGDDMRRFLWLAANVKPTDLHWSYFRPHSISEKLYDCVARDSADFISNHLKGTVEKQSQLENLTHAINEVTITDGLYLEFGVFEGVTINHIAKSLPNQTIHGFDCFDGLPEDWTLGASAGSYSTQGKVPNVEDNVRLHIGLFEGVLPAFRDGHSAPIALLHIDSDIYSSANTVLTLLEQQIVPGTVIVFDEFLNYPGFKEHEYRAFFEFIDRTGRNYRLISYVDRGFSVAIKVL